MSMPGTDSSPEHVRCIPLKVIIASGLARHEALTEPLTEEIHIYIHSFTWDNLAYIYIFEL